MQDFNTRFTKLLIANEYMKRCSVSLVLREMQIKITAIYYYTPTKMAKA